MANNLPPSKAAFYVSSYLEEFTRVLIVIGVDFIRPNVWIDEAYVVFAKPELSEGLRRSTSCESSEMYGPWLPPPEDVLKERYQFALGMFWARLRHEDKDLASHLRPASSELFTGPLNEQQIAGLHFSGAFGDQILNILRFTDCAAIKDILRKFERLPKFRIKTEKQ
jgi:hypothetical protein